MWAKSTLASNLPHHPDTAMRAFLPNLEPLSVLHRMLPLCCPVTAKQLSRGATHASKRTWPLRLGQLEALKACQATSPSKPLAKGRPAGSAFPLCKTTSRSSFLAQVSCRSTG